MKTGILKSLAIAVALTAAGSAHAVEGQPDVKAGAHEKIKQMKMENQQERKALHEKYKAEASSLKGANEAERKAMRETMMKERQAKQQAKQQERQAKRQQAVAE